MSLERSMSRSDAKPACSGAKPASAAPPASKKAPA